MGASPLYQSMREVRDDDEEAAAAAAVVSGGVLRKPKDRSVSDLSVRVRSDTGDNFPIPFILLLLLLFNPCPRIANISFSLSDHTVTATPLPLPVLAAAAAAAAAVMFSQSFGAQNGVPLARNMTVGSLGMAAAARRKDSTG